MPGPAGTDAGQPLRLSSPPATSALTLIHERVQQARDGNNPTVIARLRSGWAVLGDAQFLRGYCLLLPDPVVADLNALGAARRALFLADMAALGDAMHLALPHAVRLNYEILGNKDAALHVHIWPRYADEPEERRTSPVFGYDRAFRASRPFDPHRDAALMDSIAEHLNAAGVSVCASGRSPSWLALTGAGVSFAALALCIAHRLWN